jgi:ketosteroid isomerase-like protein
MRRAASVLAGATATIAGRAALSRMIRAGFVRDVRRLNEGDHRPLLSRYADDAVLHFHEGAHRWSGEHRGVEAIGRFLRNYTAVGIQGELGRVWLSGAPWALEIAARFSDRVLGADGGEEYSNEVVVVVRTRWGKIVEHHDFYADTVRIVDFERRLNELGVEPLEPVGAGSGSAGERAVEAP